LEPPILIVGAPGEARLVAVRPDLPLAAESGQSPELPARPGPLERFPGLRQGVLVFRVREKLFRAFETLDFPVAAEV
jgi:hypothetical protein